MSDFHEFVAELFEPLGPISIRRMFGGAGVYCGDVMFGLIIDDILYLKVVDANRADFEREGSTPFRYMRNGKEQGLSYYTMPERFMDEPDEALAWGRAALDVALSARQPKTRKRARTKA